MSFVNSLGADVRPFGSESNIKDTDTLLKCFVVHEEKSVFKPKKQIIYLGNIIDSSSMTVKLSEDKIKIIIATYTKRWLYFCFHKADDFRINCNSIKHNTKG
jgi:sRNA-binding protein